MTTMQSGKAQVEDVGGNAAEDQQQIARTSNMWISHPGLVLQSYLINRDYHLLLNNNKGTRIKGGGGWK